MDSNDRSPSAGRAAAASPRLGPRWARLPAALLAGGQNHPLLGCALRYGAAAVVVAAACGLRVAITAWVGPELPAYITFYPAVMVVALLAGLGPGLLATALAALAAAQWILPPEGLAVGSPVDRLGLVLFAGMGVFMSAIAELYCRNRRKTAEALQAERQRFNHVLDMLPAYVVLLSPDYHVPFANRFFEERFGKSYGKRCFQYLFQRAEPCENCETYKVLKSGGPLRWEWTGPDGRNYDIYDFPFADADGSPLIMEVGIDITEVKRAEAALKEANESLEQRVSQRTSELRREVEERKRAEEAMRRAKEDWEQTFDTVPDFVAILDDQHRVVRANRAMTERLGVSPEQCVGVHCYRAVHGTAAPPESCPHAHTCRDGREHTAEVYEARLGGHFLVTTTPRFDDLGRVIGAVHVARDISHFKRAEEMLRTRLRLSELAQRGNTGELIQTALDEAERHTGSSIGYFHFVDEDQQNLTLQAWSTNTLRSLCQAEGMGLHYPISQAGVWVDCFHARKPVIHNDYASLPHKKGLPEGHAPVVRDLGVPVLRGDRVVAIMGVGNKPADYTQDDVNVLEELASVTMDMVAYRRAEDALRASLAEKEVLLKEIHHRVKNNMQVISSLVSLQADGLQDAALRGTLQDVRDRVRSMALVHEKLYQSSSLARVEFAEYARSLLNYLWRAHGNVAAQVRLNLDLQPVPLSVETAVPCGLILNELAGNALKHAFKGKKGVGSGETGEGENGDGCEVKVTLGADSDGRVTLRVGDNGSGLPAGVDWRQSRSLGLRLVQMLSGQIGGTVDVATRESEGTQFEVTFHN